ncbi:RNA polymerase recycling motor HelD [Bacillus sp. KH172YL63]|uniref:RNA polymerase recycling motor HelD n=1 Tax=Bacillus sp. KH172YL63 TaxID=2709784 RepID=UPI0013E47909|nr:RNA polymerase recycling motor HelD [Bacillus sp. KH172YL63]BCB03907.1 DNA helicase [Bacillus sp. KH172YL63]
MNPDILIEQKRVDHVINIISSQIAHVEKETGKRHEEVTDIRRHFWDEVKVNTDTFDDFLETVLSLRQQAQVLTVSQSTHKQAKNRLSSLTRMKEKPYFGRIDLIEEGNEEAEPIYIGLSTLTDETGDDFLVYDWRAPIAGVYYDYPPGPAEYHTPGGVIKGLLEKKWQYLIEDGHLQSMFDTSLTIGDEILQKALGKRTDTYMRSIVATIQQKQNQIIRHDNGKLLIVQGAAGSGKTSAAMQRIAYLLYKYRGYLKPDQVILFSPNAMFNHYVSNVLPELGEENMEQVTFQEYLDHRLSGEFEIEGPYEQLEYVLTSSEQPFYDARKASITFKASIDFFQMIYRYRKSLETEGMIFKGIKFKGIPIVTGEQIRERFYGEDQHLRLHNRLEKLKEWIQSKLDITEKEERGKAWVEEEIELLSKEDYHKAEKHLAKKDPSFDYADEFDTLSRCVVRKRFKRIRKWVNGYSFVDVKKIYQQLYKDTSVSTEKLNIPKNWTAICHLTLGSLEEGKLLYEDATPYLLLKELLLGFQSNTYIKHVLIDEAQDYSSFQFEFIKRLFPAAKLTVLGDFNQAIFAHAQHHVDFNTLSTLYGADETIAVKLDQSYRSTRPIIDFTRELVPDGEQIIPFERQGKKPVLTSASSKEELHRHIVRKVEEWKKEQYHSIAILCKSAAESEEAFAALGEIPHLKLIERGALQYEQGAVVIPAYLAKGIEFDAVIIYNASMDIYKDHSLQRLFYTACTRAMHELQLYSVGKETPFLEGVSANLFIREEME